MSDIHSQDKLLEALLNNRIDLEEFKVEVENMSPEALRRLHEKLQARIAAHEHELWLVHREMREGERRLDMANFDGNRALKVAQWAGSTICETFAAIFRNPEEAQKKCWAYEQKNGVEKTARQLQRNPGAFGRLAKEAKGVAKKFDYAKFRRYFDKGTSISRKVKEVQ